VSIVQIKNWLKNQDKLWLVGYIATIVLPFGLIFNRGVTEVCVALIGTMFLANSIQNKRWEWLRDPVVKIGLIAWSWLLFISIFAQNMPESFGVAVPWIRYLLLYSALKNWVLTRSDTFSFLIKTLAFMMVFVVIDTLWQYIFGISLTGHLRDASGRLTGPLDNVKVGIFMAKMLFPIVGISLFFSSIKESKIVIISVIFLLIISIATILLTGERTAFASTMIALFAAAFLLAITERRLIKTIFMVIFIIIIESIFLLKTQSHVQGRSHQFFEVISNYLASEYGQLQKAGVLIGWEHLQTGAGLKGFRELCHKLFMDGVVTTENLHPHNLYIEWFAETGIMGLMLFISLFFCLFYKVTKDFFAHKGVNRLLPIFAIATMIVNFFPFMPTQSIFSNWPAIVLWYSVSVAMASLNLLSSQKENKL
jgi:hypothetical protein